MVSIIDSNKVRSFLGDLYGGKLSKKGYLKYLTFIILLYIFAVAVAAAVYPGGFSFSTVYTSYLGGTMKNPDGYIFYNTIVLITGILLTGHFFYSFHKIKPAPKIFNALYLFFGLVGSIGFSFIGIYHQDFDREGHQISTLVAFGGFGIAALMLFLICIIKMIRKEEFPGIKRFLLIFIPLFILIAIPLTLEGNEELIQKLHLDPAINNGRFWEWFYVLAVMVWIYCTGIAMPEDKDIK